MPVTLKTRPTASWGLVKPDTPYSIEAFNAAKDPYHVASYSNIPVPYPFIIDSPSTELTRMMPSVATQQRITQLLGNHPMKFTTICTLTMARLGMPEEKHNILRFMVDCERDKAAWKKAANFLQVLFESESKKQGTYVPFRVVLNHLYRWYDDDKWMFLTARDERTKAIRAVKDVIREECTKLIPEEMRDQIIYRMIKRGHQPDAEAAGGRLQPRTDEAPLLSEVA